MNIENAFNELYSTIKKLRSPEGCPWDKKQTPESLMHYLIEETYECFDAIIENDTNNVSEELGDLYLLVTMIAYMYEEKNYFSVYTTLKNIINKLKRRHPHVFSNYNVENSDEVSELWNDIKTNIEGKKKKHSHLDSISKSLPPLEKAYEMQKKASELFFDWETKEQVLNKFDEEYNEFLAAIVNNDINSTEEEIGDLLFTLINIARFLHVNPLLALHKTNNKFYNRFTHIEKMMKLSNKSFKKENIDIMEAYWQKSKEFDT